MEWAEKDNEASVSAKHEALQIQCQALALYSFDPACHPDAGSSDDLTGIRAGEVVFVYDALSDPDWWYVANLEGTFGWVPASYLGQVVPSPLSAEPEPGSDQVVEDSFTIFAEVSKDDVNVPNMEWEQDMGSDFAEDSPIAKVEIIQRLEVPEIADLEWSEELGEAGHAQDSKKLDKATSMTLSLETVKDIDPASSSVVDAYSPDPTPSDKSAAVKTAHGTESPSQSALMANMEWNDDSDDKRNMTGLVSLPSKESGHFKPIAAVARVSTSEIKDRSSPEPHRSQPLSKPKSDKKPENQTISKLSAAIRDKDAADLAAQSVRLSDSISYLPIESLPSNEPSPIKTRSPKKKKKRFFSFSSGKKDDRKAKKAIEKSQIKVISQTDIAIASEERQAEAVVSFSASSQSPSAPVPCSKIEQLPLLQPQHLASLGSPPSLSEHPSPKPKPLARPALNAAPPSLPARPMEISSKPKPDAASELVSAVPAVPQRAKATHNKASRDAKKKTGVSLSDLREWSDASGTYKLQAAFLSLSSNAQNQKVVYLLKASGAKVSVPLQKLCAADVAYIHDKTGEKLDDFLPVSQNSKAPVALQKTEPSRDIDASIKELAAAVKNASIDQNNRSCPPSVQSNPTRLTPCLQPEPHSHPMLPQLVYRPLLPPLPLHQPQQRPVLPLAMAVPLIPAPFRPPSSRPFSRAPNSDRKSEQGLNSLTLKDIEAFLSNNSQQKKMMGSSRAEPTLAQYPQAYRVSYQPCMASTISMANRPAFFPGPPTTRPPSYNNVLVHESRPPLMHARSQPLAYGNSTLSIATAQPSQLYFSHFGPQQQQQFAQNARQHLPMPVQYRPQMAQPTAAKQMLPPQNYPQSAHCQSGPLLQFGHSQISTRPFSGVPHLQHQHQQYLASQMGRPVQNVPPQLQQQGFAPSHAYLFQGQAHGHGQQPMSSFARPSRPMPQPGRPSY